MRNIDRKHYIDDEGRLRKAAWPYYKRQESQTDEEIPEDEPLFLFRARDALAMTTLIEYQHLCYDAGCAPAHVQGITDAIDDFARFKRDHPERMKEPGSSMRRPPK